MKYIYLLRHGKAELSSAAEKDSERSLTECGISHSRTIGEYINSNLGLPQKILYSSARRTKQTLKYMQESIDCEIKSSNLDNLYLASCGELFSISQSISDDIDILMIIGHNPGIHEFCLTLAANGDADSMSKVEYNFPTAAFVSIELDIKHWQDLAPAVGKLLAYRDGAMIELSYC